MAMIDDRELLTLRQFALSTALQVTALPGIKEALTIEWYLEISEKLEDFLLRARDDTKSRLGTYR